MQFVSVQFQAWDRRSYTYHWEGEPLAIGDKVVVETKAGQVEVEVVTIRLDTPDFPTKPVIRRA
jgi:hypothetical protein